MTHPTNRRCIDCEHVDHHIDTGLICGIQLPPHLDNDLDDPKRAVEYDHHCDLWSLR